MESQDRHGQGEVSQGAGGVPALHVAAIAGAVAAVLGSGAAVRAISLATLVPSTPGSGPADAQVPRPHAPLLHPAPLVRQSPRGFPRESTGR